MKKHLIVGVLSLLVVISMISFGVMADGYPNLAITTSPGVSVQISPQMELLAGVLSQTSWIQNRGPQGGGNAYFRDLQAFFAPWKDHQAVQIAQKLTSRGFTYDAPPAFMMHHGPLPELKQIGEYSEYLVGRAGGVEILNEFRAALVDLARESKFEEFLTQHAEVLQNQVATTAAAFDSAKVVNWLTDFFGWAGNEYYMVLTPSMFPGGGYGANVTRYDGTQLITQVIRENGTSKTAFEFPSGKNLEYLALHEWGHSFVNPSVELYPKQVKQLNHLYKKVAQVMQRQAYSTTEIFLNEQILRAVTTIAIGELYGEELAKSVMQNEASRGFYLTEYTVEQLKNYRTQREQYPRFDQYVPHLLEQYATDEVDQIQVDERFANASSSGNSRMRMVLIGAGILLAGGLIWILFK